MGVGEIKGRVCHDQWLILWGEVTLLGNYQRRMPGNILYNYFFSLFLYFFIYILFFLFYIVGAKIECKFSNNQM